MLRPGEVRVALLPAGLVKVYSVAGGSFTHVRHENAEGVMQFARNYQFETAALVKFAEIKNTDKNGVSK